MPLRDIGTVIWDSFSNSLTVFFNFLPSLIGALLILVVGWVVAGVVARLVERGLRAVGFEHAIHNSGLGEFVARSGAPWTTTQILAALVKWSIRLIFLQAAATVLGMPQLTTIINSIVLFVPQLIVGLVILVVGFLVAKFVGGLVQASASEMEFRNPQQFAAFARAAIIVFAAAAALDQVGIAPTIVNSLFIGLVAAASLAVGLAFGLGGRDVASELLRKVYRGRKEMMRGAQDRSINGHQLPNARPRGMPPSRA